MKALSNDVVFPGMNTGFQVFIFIFILDIVFSPMSVLFFSLYVIYVDLEDDVHGVDLPCDD
jgi:hypothetical protein